MKSRTRIFAFAGLILMGGLFAWVFFAKPKHPVALLRVVDAAGKPIAGAVITPDALRPKKGAYRSNHYGWRGNVPNTPITTDADGFARVPYPKYVFERIETGQITFSVDHPDFVSDRPFREVATAPPAGAPWKEWLVNLRDRIQRKQFISEPDPVVLRTGEVLKLVARNDVPSLADAPLHAQIAGEGGGTNFWQRPEPGVLLTRRLKAGPQVFRALRFDTNGTAWFSKIISFNAPATNEFELTFQRSVSVRGRLDDSVPRPVVRGRVFGHVSQPPPSPVGNPPGWHTWAEIREDGSFEFTSLPPGKFGVVALCDGFVSTNGPGNMGAFTYPQPYSLDTNDLNIVVGMERTARLEVKVLDPDGKPLSGATASTWPNVLYEQFGSTILASDRWDFASSFRAPPTSKSNGGYPESSNDFYGVSGSNGVAILPNVPVHVAEFSVSHKQFDMPAIKTSWGEKRRYGTVSLIPGTNNYATVKMERREQTPIKHY